MAYKYMAPPGRPANWADRGGLQFRAYSVFAGSSNQPDPSELTSARLTIIAGISSEISGFTIPTTRTYVWRGYFKADVDSDTWQFRTTSKDGSFLWLDDNAELAIASLNRSDAIVENGGTHSSTTVTSDNISLKAGYWYAITLISANNTGTGSATLEWSSNGGTDWSSDGGTYFFRDSRYPDGFGADKYTPSVSAASHWVVGPATGTGDVGYAANSDRTSWTFYDRMPANAAAIDAAYGKDASGNGIYVMTNSSSDRELAVSSTDITDGNQWTYINLGGTGQFCAGMAWANDSTGSTSGVWFASRDNGKIYRSTDGASSFSEVSLSSLSGHNTQPIVSIVGNGTGQWICGQDNRLYRSTNDGLSFSVSTPLGSNVEDVLGVGYTNNAWVVVYTKTGASNLYIKVADVSNFANWSNEVDSGIAKPATVGHLTARANIAAYKGRVVVVSGDKQGVAVFDVNGTELSNLFLPSISMPDARDVTTDGTTWMLVTEGGDIFESTDSGATWTKTVDDVQGNGDNMNCVVASVYLSI
tara:strand:- start:842 stop:2431 length:1590 start_codon:yes stop_codon:yes gene_type:complete